MLHHNLPVSQAVRIAFYYTATNSNMLHHNLPVSQAVRIAFYYTATNSNMLHHNLPVSQAVHCRCIAQECAFIARYTRFIWPLHADETKSSVCLLQF